MVRTMASTLFALRRFIITSRSYHPKWLSDTFLHKPALLLAEVRKLPFSPSAQPQNMFHMLDSPSLQWWSRTLHLCHLSSHHLLGQAAVILTQWLQAAIDD